jgi:DNA-binding response OmpR family regulator
MDKILVLEDVREMQMVINRAVRHEQTEIFLASKIGEANRLLNENQFKLILLDVTLPDGDGLGFLTSLRQNPATKEIPVMLLTSNSEIEDKVLAFSLGADDYVTKPFNPLELRARVLAKLKKLRAPKLDHHSIRVGSLRLDTLKFQAFSFSGEKETLIDLTPLEFKLLTHFARHEEQIFTRDQLINVVRGDNIHILDRTIDTHISNLRKKISVSSLAIRTIYGVGYSLTKEALKKKKAA